MLLILIRLYFYKKKLKSMFIFVKLFFTDMKQTCPLYLLVIYLTNLHKMSYHHKYLFIIVVICSLCIILSIYLKSLIWVWLVKRASSIDQAYFFWSWIDIHTQSWSSITWSWWIWINNLHHVQSMNIQDIDTYLQNMKQASDALADQYHNRSISDNFRQEVDKYLSKYYGK